ncbi:hypothetical protein L596_013617 [Steinernema carpocapsae]|uniref:Protein kinase domain-containing protein n=1 Tax=Steinernema carpocapsae TaxID=34508 RepID=A0A4U5P0P7_STECR|nr:hypothetical protein L596_013617 [Steinernema carpocapsae]
MPHKHIRFLLYQLLCGVRYLLDSRIIHRCLTPDNIGVNKNCSLKLLGSKQPSPDSLSSPVDKESVTMPNAKNFLIKVLKIDLDERMTVREVLQHFNVKCWYEEAG